MNTEELYASALEDLRRGFFLRGETRLRRAAEANHAPAQLALARRLLCAPAPRARRDGLDWLARAADCGLTAAIYFRAALRYEGAEDGFAATESALGDLNEAAAAAHPPAEVALALAWLERPEPGAQNSGNAWLARAESHGSRIARVLRRLVGARDCDSGQSVVPPLESWAPLTSPGTLRVLCDSPRIVQSDGALSPAECAWLRLVARHPLKPSRIFDPVTGRARADPVRTGMTMYFDPGHVEIPVVRMIERLAAYAEREVSCAEPLAVLRYGPGEEYKPHYDGLGAQALVRDPFRDAGNRAATALAYLNCPTAGGSTVFPLLDIAVHPQAGRLLVFENLDADGRPTPASLHAGAPVEPVANGSLRCGCAPDL